MTEYNPENIFARIIRGEIPCHKIYEDDQVLAFHDIAPAAPVHVLVIPKAPYRSFDDFAIKAGAQMMASFFRRAQMVATSLGLAEDGYRLITNHGQNASQSVPHFHVHILAGRPLGGLVPEDTQPR